MNSAVAFLAVMYLGLLIGGMSVRYGVYAILIHELGHFLIYLLLMRRPPRIIMGVAGFSIEMPCLSRARSALLLSSGVLANLFAVGVTLVFNAIKPDYESYFFMVANLGVAIFNLIPLPFSDGGRLLLTVVDARHLNAVEQVFAVFTAVVCAGLLILILFSDLIPLQISLILVIITIILKMMR